MLVLCEHHALFEESKLTYTHIHPPTLNAYSTLVVPITLLL